MPTMYPAVLLKPIPDFPEYSISEDGRVWSNKTYNNRKPGWLKRTPNSTNRLSVDLQRDGKGHTQAIHRLVALTFLGEPPEDKPLACHRNGNHLDNRSSNLYWGDHSDNVQDSLRHGTNANANKTYCKNGHEYNEENTYLRPTGGRNCKACAKDRENGYRAAKKAKREGKE